MARRSGVLVFRDPAEVKTLDVATGGDVLVVTSTGPRGASAYAVAVAHGFIGTEEDWLNSLGGEGSTGPDGASAYEVAVANGFVGDVTAWLASLEGDVGPEGPQGPPGNDGADGAPGADGADSTVPGPPGADGDDGATGPPGPDGDSAYEVAVSNGFVGTEVEWLASLQGADGADGAPGADGADGAPGADGDDGAPGAPGVGVPTGGTANQVLKKNSGTDYDTSWATPTPPPTDYAKNNEGGLELIAVPAATTGAVTLDLDDGSVFKITPTGNITLTVADHNADSTHAATIMIVVIQGATPRTVGLMTGGVWLGTAPTQTANKTCVITATTVDGGTTWLCSGVVQA